MTGEEEGSPPPFLAVSAVSLAMNRGPAGQPYMRAHLHLPPMVIRWFTGAPVNPLPTLGSPPPDDSLTNEEKVVSPLHAGRRCGGLRALPLPRYRTAQNQTLRRFWFEDIGRTFAQPEKEKSSLRLTVFEEGVVGVVRVEVEVEVEVEMGWCDGGGGDGDGVERVLIGKRFKEIPKMPTNGDVNFMT
ncbi:hypothetical protein Dimus_032885 [Dionaea muscipula]